VIEPPRKLLWRRAVISDIVTRTATVKSFFVSLAEPMPFVAGQHVDVRLTAEDGYQAQRSYSIASAPELASTKAPYTFELAIERLEDGEVSPYFHEVAAIGDEIEFRGPIGGYFVWSAQDEGPILLVGGGSGVVPLMSMIRHRAAVNATAPAGNTPTGAASLIAEPLVAAPIAAAQPAPHSPATSLALLFSARTWNDVIFRDELLALHGESSGFELKIALTREALQREGVFTRRVDTAMLSEILARLPQSPKQVFICGSNPFVETAAQSAIEAGLAAAIIRTERYGG
jgi:ferredoxin-NADP reductase